MELFKRTSERIRTKRTRMIEERIARQAGSITTALCAGVEADKQGPFAHEVGIPPIGYRPEQFIDSIREQVSQRIEATTAAGEIAYNPTLTHIRCSDESSIRLDQFPKQTKPSLTVVFDRVS